MRYVAVALALLVACSSGGGDTSPLPPPPPPPTLPVPVASVSVAPDSVVLVVASTVQLTATARDSAFGILPNRVISWSTDNPAVASVSSTGLVSGVSVGGAVRVTATSESRSGTSTITVIAPSSGTVGPPGGSFSAPNGAGIVTISQGAVEQVVSVSVRDSQPHDQRYAPLGPHGVAVHIPITGTVFGSSGTFQVTIPLNRALQPGGVAYFRASFAGVPGVFWAPATTVANNSATLSIPSSGMEEFKAILGVDVLDAMFDVEEVPEPATSVRSSFSFLDRPLAPALTFRQACQPLPFGASPPRYVACGVGTLTPIAAASVGTNARIGVVFVHGWEPDVADWVDYYQDQGLICAWVPFPGWQCAVSPSAPSGGSKLPGSEYFRSLLAALQGSAASTLSGAPLFAFDYESHQDYSASGLQLAARLVQERAKGNVDRFVIIGHSMGVLVARKAAQQLESNGNPQLLEGIVGLAGPNNGTPYPLLTVAQVFSGVRTPGGISLSVPLPHNERTPLYLFGGDISFGDLSDNTLQYYAGGYLCKKSPPDCRNDGVVPISSALMQPADAADNSLVRHNDYVGYAHAAMIEGLRRGSLASDPLFSDITNDLGTIFSRAGAVQLRFTQAPTTVAAGASIAPGVTVEVDDGRGQKLAYGSYAVTVSLATGVGGAVLNGTRTVTTVGGSASFTDLSVNLAGQGYTLRATAVGLSTTSAAFTVSAAPTATLVATPTTSAFVVIAGASVPSAQAVALTKGESGTLIGLAVGAIGYGVSEPAGWLGTATLNSTTTPATLSLQPNTSNLPPATYHATVPVSAAGGVSTNVNVTYAITAIAPLAAPTLTAPANGASGISTAPTLSWSTVSGADRYWLMIATTQAALPTDPATSTCPGCTVSGVTGLTSHALPNAFPNGTGGGIHPALASGTQYFWKVQGFNTNGTLGQYSSTNTFTTAATGPSMVLDRTTVPFAYTINGVVPGAQIVNITNGGTGSLNGLTVSPITYGPGQPTGWLGLPVIGTAAPTTLSFGVSPVGIPAGSYSATVQVSSSAPGATGTPRTITIMLAVSAAAAAPTIGVSSTTATFGATVGGGSPGAQNGIQVVNAGTGVLSGLATVINYQAGQPTGWLSASLSSSTAPATLTLTATLGALPSGTYDATVAVTSTATGVTNSPRTVDVTFTVAAGAAQFVQQGQKLVGTISAGNTGYQGGTVAVSGDGNTAIIGEVKGFGITGGVWVWTRSGGAWTQQAVLGDFTASSVAISADGNTAIIGHPDDNGGRGSVAIWTRSGGTWAQQGPRLAASDANGLPSQGTSVSLSSDGNTAAVGGEHDSWPNGTGAAWIWTRNGGVWTQQGTKLVGGGTGGTTKQGHSVGLSADGNTVIVGSPNGNNSLGAAWVWSRNGGVWTQQGPKLVGSDDAGGAMQGISVSLSADGNTAIVGGYRDANNGFWAGAAWIWTRNGGTWSQQGPKLIGSGAQAGRIGFAEQGFSVSISGDGNTAVVGGPADNSGFGASWVWRRTGSLWTQLGPKLFGSGGADPASQGYSVSISSDGKTIIVGGNNDNNQVGAAWVFTAGGAAGLRAARGPSGPR